MHGAFRPPTCRQALETHLEVLLLGQNVRHLKLIAAISGTMGPFVPVHHIVRRDQGIKLILGSFYNFRRYAVRPLFFVI